MKKRGDATLSDKIVIAVGVVLLLIGVYVVAEAKLTGFTGHTTGSIRIGVLDNKDSNNLKFVTSATVTLESGSTTYTGVFAPQTFYDFTNIPVGTYTLRVQAGGYTPNPYTEQFSIVAGTNTNRNVFISAVSQICTDSDGGINYDVKGTVTVGGQVWEDSCQSSSVVNENFCNTNNLKETTVSTCLNGCSNGACVTASGEGITQPPVNSLWSFNEASWTTDAVGGVKASIGGKDGTAKGSVNTVAQGVSGKAGNFDGVDDYVDVAGFSWAAGGPVTVMFWLRAPSAGLKEGAVFGAGSDNANRFAAYLWSDKNLYWDYGWVSNPPQDGRVGVDMTPYLDKWVHVALVSEGNNGKFKGIYINGQKAAEEANSDGPDVALNGLSIGRGLENNAVWRYANGIIDEVNITNKVASADEIKAVYERERKNLVSAGGLGLVSQWSFQEESIPNTAGGVKDSIGALHGTAKNGVASVGEGIGGKAARFDGIDDEIVIPNAAVLSPTSALTVSGWFKTANLTAGDVTVSWVSKRDTFVLGPWSDGNVSFYAFLNEKYQSVMSAPKSVKEGVWQHWVATYDGSALILYLNGMQAAQQPASGPLGTSGELYLGHDFIANSPSYKRYFNGMMDEVQVYDKALSAEEVKALHGAQLKGFVAPAAAPTVLSACGRISAAGAYTLDGTLKTSSGTCLEIEASNVVLDGRRFTIEGTGSDPATVPGKGIEVKGQNVTLNDVKVEGFGIGVVLQSAKGAKLSNVKAGKNLYQGLFINWTNGSVISDSIFESNGDSGVLLVHSGGNTVRDSTFRSNEGYGVFFKDKSVKNKIERAVFFNNTRGESFNDETSRDNTITRRSAGGDEPTGQLVIQPTQLRGAGYTQSMSVGESLLFRVNVTTHNLSVESFANNIVRITIKSTPVTFTLSPGEAKKVDLDSNNFYDLSVTFVSATLGKPRITLQAINEKVVELPPGGGLIGNGTGGSGVARVNATKNETGNGKGPWDQTTWIVVIAVLAVFIVVVIIAIVYALRNRSLSTQEQRFYRPEPHSSVLQQPSTGFGGPSFGGP